MQSGPEQLRDWIRRRTATDRNPDGNQREAARIIGMDPTFLSQLLTKRRSPALGTAVAIERTTGIPVEAWLPLADGDAAEAIVAAARNLQEGKA